MRALLLLAGLLLLVPSGAALLQTAVTSELRHGRMGSCEAAGAATAVLVDSTGLGTLTIAFDDPQPCGFQAYSFALQKQGSGGSYYDAQGATGSGLVVQCLGNAICLGRPAPWMDVRIGGIVWIEGTLR